MSGPIILCVFLKVKLWDMYDNLLKTKINKVFLIIILFLQLLLALPYNCKFCETESFYILPLGLNYVDSATFVF